MALTCPERSQEKPRGYILQSELPSYLPQLLRYFCNVNEKSGLVSRPASSRPFRRTLIHCHALKSAARLCKRTCGT